MKKFFSLLCAFALVMSAFAAPKFNQPMKAGSFKNLHKVEFAQKNHIDAKAATLQDKAIFRAPAAVMDAEDLSDAIVEIACTYYSNAAFSQPGAYDYYFQLMGAEDADGFPSPLVLFDLYLPTDTGLVDGYYSMSNGEIDAAMIFTDYYEYMYAMYFGMAPAFDVVDAEFTVETVSAGVYNLELILSDAAGNTITITKLDLPLAVTENTLDPNQGGSTGGGSSTVGGDYSWEPTAATTISFAATTCDVLDYIEDYGEMLIRLADANHTYQLNIELFLDALDANGNIPAGTYQVSDSQAANTVWASPGGDDTYDYGTFLMTDFNASNQYSTAYYVVSGSLVIAYDAQGNMNLTFNGTTYNGSTIQITYSGAVTSQPTNVLEYDNNSDFSASFTSVSAQAQDYADNGLSTVVVKAENAQGKAAYMLFVLPLGSTYPAAGNYPIEDSEDTNTVIASNGVDDEGNIYYSFAAQLSNGQLTADGIWFMVGGSVTVNADKSMQINAVNSYGNTITATVAAPTALEDVNADASAAKKLINGQLFIEKDGKFFNALGVEMK